MAHAADEDLDDGIYERSLLATPVENAMGFEGSAVRLSLDDCPEI